MSARVGLCGFTMAMEDYPLHFPVVEIQHTFYQPPRDEVMRRWIASTPPSLEYTMKVWQLVTHAAGSPTYRKMKNGLPAGAEPGFFRDSAGPHICNGKHINLTHSIILLGPELTQDAMVHNL